MITQSKKLNGLNGAEREAETPNLNIQIPKNIEPPTPKSEADWPSEHRSGGEEETRDENEDEDDFARS